MRYFICCIRKYVDFSGRARRAEFWYFMLFSLLFTLVAWLVDLTLFGPATLRAGGVFYPLANIFLLLPSLSVTVRRMHDTGRSGKRVLWYVLFVVVYSAAILVMALSVFAGAARDGGPSLWMKVCGGIAIVGTAVCLVWNVLLIVWCARRGTVGDNRYGADPLELSESEPD